MLDRLLIASRLFRFYRRTGHAILPAASRAWRVSK